jgi:thymidylate kinase
MKENTLISFSGIDGAGKTTQIKLLSEFLNKNNKKVLVTEKMFGYFLLKPLISSLRSVTKSPSLGPVTRNKNPLLKLWFIPAFFDIWVSYLINIKPKLKDYDYIIADRFYTDIWANLLYYGYLPKWAFILIKFLPKTDYAIVLYANPNNILKREREFESSYYFEQEKIYKLIPKYINVYSVDANGLPGKVSESIKSHLGLENLGK